MASSSNNICATELCRRSAAAAGASFLSIIVTTPFDVIKVRTLRSLRMSCFRSDSHDLTSSGSATRFCNRSRSIVSKKSSLFYVECHVRRLAIAACPNMCYQGPVASIKASALCPPTCNIYHSTTDAMRKMMRQVSFSKKTPKDPFMTGRRACFLERHARDAINGSSNGRSLFASLRDIAQSYVSIGSCCARCGWSNSTNVFDVLRCAD